MPPITHNPLKEDHNNETFWSDLDWIIDRDTHNVELDPKYADDVNFIRTHQSKINEIKRIIPSMLKKGNLVENKDKREEFHVPDEKDKWKNCKCLGTFMDTEKDINNRKIRAFDSMLTLQPLLKSRHLTIETKLRIFNAYVSSIFLYNCGLWTTTKTINNKIDSFHRRLLRKTLGINWPNKISNAELYEETKERKWSNIVKERRLSWLGSY